MPEKKFQNVSVACRNDIQAFVHKTFDKEFVKAGHSFSVCNCRWKWDCRPHLRGKHIFSKTGDRLTLSIQTDETGQNSIVLVVTTVSDFYVVTCAETDDFGYKKVSQHKVSDVPEEQIAAWLDGWMRGKINGSHRFNVDGHHVSLSLEFLEGMKKEPVTDYTFLPRYLVRNCGVLADDPRVAKTADYLVAWLAKEIPTSGPLVMLQGKDITNAYKNSVGASSCMVAGKSPLTSLYANNPDVCKLAVLYNDVKPPGTATAIGRCLVWTVGDTWYGDRIYPEVTRIHVLFEEALTKAAKAAGAKFIRCYPHQVSVLPPIRMKLCPHEYCPYMDSYRWGRLLNKGDEILIAPSENAFEAWIKANNAVASSWALDRNGEMSSTAATAKMRCPEDKDWVASPCFGLYVEGGQQIVRIKQAGRYLKRPDPPDPPPEEKPVPKAVPVEMPKVLLDGLNPQPPDAYHAHAVAEARYHDLLHAADGRPPQDNAFAYAEWLLARQGVRDRAAVINLQERLAAIGLAVPLPNFANDF